jgi:hypothetical protein
MLGYVTKIIINVIKKLKKIINNKITNSIMKTFVKVFSNNRN